MLVNNGMCVYTIPRTGKLALYSTVYCALFIVEAKYIVMTEAMKETIWLQRLLDDLGID